MKGSVLYREESERGEKGKRGNGEGVSRDERREGEWSMERVKIGKRREGEKREY